MGVTLRQEKLSCSIEAESIEFKHVKRLDSKDNISLQKLASK